MHHFEQLFVKQDWVTLLEFLLRLVELRQEAVGQDANNSDVTVRCDGGRLFLHRNILMSRSEYLKASQSNVSGTWTC